MSWLRDLIARTAQPRPAPRRRSRGGFRPRLEGLEDRCVPATLYVSSSADDVNQMGTLRWAVANAQSGDTIDILPLDNGQARHITLRHGELYLNQNVTIQSIGLENATIDGNFSSRVFEVTRSASVRLLGLNIIDGNAIANNSLGNAIFDGDGGGILSEGTLTLDHCFVSNNGETSFGANNKAMKAGGGVYNYHGTLTITDYGGVDNNFAGTGGGGAIVTVFGAVWVDEGCWLSHNQAGSGGAIACDAGSVEISNCKLEQNTAKILGGALLDTAGSMTVTDGTVLVGNHAKDGGGIYNELGHLYVNNNSVLNQNTATADGGGIASRGGTMEVSNSHLYSNTAGDTGGGIWDRLSKVTVNNSDLQFNSALAGGGIYNWKGDLKVTDSNLTSNSASFFGGGIATLQGTVSVTGSQLTGNSAPAGAAIFNGGGTVTIGTTQFTPNPPDNIDGPWIDQGGNTFL
jgi:predicted outer membrane repeat protein